MVSMVRMRLQMASGLRGLEICQMTRGQIPGSFPQPNCCLKPTACGTFAARQTSPGLARRSLIMR
jgi:hypothetical protein